MKTMMTSRPRVLGLAVAASLLSACGGGGGSPAGADPFVSGTEVPLSATTSSSGALAFVKTVAASSDNSAEPIVVGDAVLAVSDTDEPDPGI